MVASIRATGTGQWATSTAPGAAKLVVTNMSVLRSARLATGTGPGPGGWGERSPGLSFCPEQRAKPDYF